MELSALLRDWFSCQLGDACLALDPLTAVVFGELRLPHTVIATLCGGALVATGVVSTTQSLKNLQKRLQGLKKSSQGLTRCGKCSLWL